MIQEDRDRVFKWYNRLDVLYKILPYLRDREFCLIRAKNEYGANIHAIRNLRVNNVQQLIKVYRWSNAKDKNVAMNFYYSVERYVDGLPYQTLNIQKRNNKHWNATSHKHIDVYDWVIDIDCLDHMDYKFGRYACIKITDLLDDHNVPYYLRFSGCGFHIVIDGMIIKDALNVGREQFDPDSENNIYAYLKGYTEKIRDLFSDQVDSDIVDHRRVIKIPYSLAPYDYAVFVCLPIEKSKLPTYQLEDFLLSNFEMTSIRPLPDEKLNNPNGTREDFISFLDTIDKLHSKVNTKTEVIE
jgi:hypothetical protein